MASDEAASPSIFTIFTAVLCLLVIIGLFQKIINALRNELNTVPGPQYAKWTNLRLKWAVITGQRIHYVHAMHETYGPIVRIAPDEVSVGDPASVTKIHKINSGFNKSPWYITLVGMERPALFSMNDPRQHAMRRRMFARAFSKSTIRASYEPLVHAIIRAAVSKMFAELHSGRTTDVLKWWTFMATDVSARLMFGDSFHMVESGQVNEYVRVLTNALKGGGIGAELPLLKSLLKFVPVKSLQEVFRGNDLLLKYGLETRKWTQKSRGNDTIFAAIDKEAEQEAGHLDEVDVLLEAQGLLVAGSDTTAVSLTYLVWAVLSHPEWHQSLRSELSILPEVFTEADLDPLPILNAIVEETLRLYGAAPGGLPRIVPPSGATLHGYFMPAGTTVTTQSYTLHRDPALFPEPYRFDPSRWLGAGLSDPAKAMYSPFGFGSRTCIGLHLARMEMKLAAVEFFKREEVCLSPSTTPHSMRLENFFLIAPASHKCEVMLA